MKRTIQVFLDDEANWVGTSHYDAAGSRERAAFSYTDAWLTSANRFAIEPSLSLVTGPQFHRKVPNGSVFHGVFADTEPACGPNAQWLMTMADCRSASFPA